MICVSDLSINVRDGRLIYSKIANHIDFRNVLRRGRDALDIPLLKTLLTVPLLITQLPKVPSIIFIFVLKLNALYCTHPGSDS